MVLIDQTERERFDSSPGGVAARRRDRVERDERLGHIERARERSTPDPELYTAVL